jgi:hypothetical protein
MSCTEVTSFPLGRPSPTWRSLWRDLPGLAVALIAQDLATATTERPRGGYGLGGLSAVERAE